MLNVISYGGGVQSTAMIVLAAKGIIDYPTALFSNVGDDSEHPSTLEYVRNIAMPWAAKHGIEVIELHRTNRYGEPTETIYQKLVNPEHRSFGIPVRMSTGAPARRSCTVDYKIRVVAKYLRQNGATKDNPAHVAIGISTDEIQRANNKQPFPYEIVDYPLLDLGYSRTDCEKIIYEAGLPVPPKSSCYFCPFHKKSTWQEMRRDEPELFRKAVELEKLINQKRKNFDQNEVWLTRSLRPLDESIEEAPSIIKETEDGPEGCDEGYCWT